MGKLKKILLIGLLFASVVSAIAPQCNVNLQFDNQNWFVSENETFIQNLDRYFSGFNLSFQSNQPGLVINSALQIAPGNSQQVQGFVGQQQIFAVANVSTDDQISLAVLSANGNIQFMNNTNLATWSSGMALLSSQNIQAVNASAQNCVGMNFLNQKISLALCQANFTQSQRVPELNITLNQTTTSNYFVLQNCTADQAYCNTTGATLLNDYFYSDVSLQVKILNYQSSDITSTVHNFITLTPYTQFQYGPVASNYLQIYRWVLPMNPTSQNPNGIITQNPPLTAECFNVTKIQIIDFAVFNEYIFLLDNANNQVIRFQYIGNQVLDLQYFPLNQSSWGISVALYKTQLIMTIATMNSINEYTIQVNGMFSPKQNFQYEVLSPINSLVQLSVSQDFVTVKTSSNLFVYSRNNKQSSQIIAAPQNLTATITLSNNQVVGVSQFFSDLKIQLIQIGRPNAVLTQALNQTLNNTIITATSFSGASTSNCKFTVNQIFFTNPTFQDVLLTNQLIDFSGIVPADWNAQFPLSPQFAGPNIQYSLTVPQLSKNAPVLVTPLLDQPATVKVGGETLPPDTLQIVQVISKDASNYFLLQISIDMKASFQTCFQVLVDQKMTATCVQIAQITFDAQVNASRTGQYIGKNVFALKVGNEDSLIRLYTTDGVNVQNVSLTGLTARDFNLQGSQLMVISGNTSAVYFYDLSIANPALLGVLTNTTVSSWGLGFSFNPMWVVSFQDSYIILTDSSILFVQFQGSNFVYQNSLTGQMYSSIFISGNSLIASISNGLLQYSLENLNNIVLLKTLPLYNFQFLTGFPLHKTIAVYRQTLYLLATNGFTTSLLIYQTNQPLINSLFSIVQVTNERIVTSDALSVAVNGVPPNQPGELGVDTYYVLCNDGIVSVRTPSYISIQFTYNKAQQQILAENITFQYSVQDWLKVNPPIVKIVNVSVINTGTHIILNSDTINQSPLKSNLNIAKGQSVKTIPFNDSGWYTGAVLGYKISCPSCGQEINIQNRVQLGNQSGIAQIPNVMDTFWDQLTQQMYVLFKDDQYKLIILNNTLGPANMATTLDGLDASVNTCNFLLPNFQSNGVLFNMFVVCATKGSAGMSYTTAVPVAQLGDQLIPANPIIFSEIQQLSGINIWNTMYLFMLEGSNGPTNGIYVFEIDYTNSTSSCIVSLVTADFDVSLANQFINSFDLLPLPGGDIVVVAGTPQNNLLNGLLTLVPSIGFQQQQTVNLAVFLNNQPGLYIAKNSMLQKLAIISGNNATFQLIYQSTASPIYELTGSLNEMGFISMLQVTQAFQTYGNNVPAHQLKVWGNQIAAAYINATSKQVSIAIYQRLFRGSSEGVLGYVNGVPVSTMIAGMAQNYITASPIVAFNFYTTTNGTVKLFNQQPSISTIQSIDLNPTPAVIISGQNWNNQTVTFSLISDFVVPGQDVFTIQANNDNTYFPPKPPTPPVPKPPSDAWWIALIVIGSLLVIGLVAYLIYRHKKNRREFKEEARESQIHMTEPLTKA